MSITDINTFGHVMIDIETMGTKSYSAIISIAAVEFNIETGIIGQTFYQNISLQSNVSNGLVIDPDTVIWWIGQNEAARKKLSENPSELIQTLLLLDQYLVSCGPDAKLWGNPARFDLGLLENAYQTAFLKSPWEHYNERCLRTLSSLRPEIKKRTIRKGPEHDATADCLFQIEYAVAIWKEINNKY